MAEVGKVVQVENYKYTSKPDHRDGTPSKSQWNVPIAEEYEAFSLGICNDWVDGQSAWGLKLENGDAVYLGRSAIKYGPADPLFVAFFQLSVICHGYPSDPKRSNREVPPDKVRSDWLSKRYLRAAVVRKLGRGLTCRL
jgi:hypothetical protein